MNGIGSLVSAYVHTRAHGHCHKSHAASAATNPSTTASTDPSTDGAIKIPASTQGPAASVVLSDAAQAKFAAWMTRHEGPSAGATVVPAPTVSPAAEASSDPISLAPPTA